MHIKWKEQLRIKGKETDLFVNIRTHLAFKFFSSRYNTVFEDRQKNFQQ